MPEQTQVQAISPGIVRIGDVAPAPAGFVSLSVAGGTVTVDPTRPSAAPTCVISDLDAAQPTLELLYGSPVAAAVAREASDPAGSPPRVDVDDSIERDVLVRLGHVRWCQLHSPLPLDPTLLQLEEISLAGALPEGILDDDPAWSDELAILGEALLAFTADQRALPAVSGLEDLILAVLELMATRLPVADPLAGVAAERLRSWAPRGRDEAAAEAALAHWAAQLQPAGAAFAGGTSALFAGTSTVDWLDVPPHHLSTEERNVHWSATLAGHRAQVSVAADVAPRTRPLPGLELPPARLADRLAFDGHLTGLPFPVVTGALRLDPLSGAWVGETDVVGKRADLLEDGIEAGKVFDVRVRGLDPGPRRSPTYAEAERWSARGVSAARLHSLGEVPDLRSSAAAAWRRASFLWKASGQSEKAEWCAMLGLAAATPGERDRTWEDAGPQTLSAGLGFFTATFAERWLAVGNPI